MILSSGGASATWLWLECNLIKLRVKCWFTWTCFSLPVIQVFASKCGQHWVDWDGVEAALKQLIRWKHHIYVRYKVVYWNTETLQAVFTAMRMRRQVTVQLGKACKCSSLIDGRTLSHAGKERYLPGGIKRTAVQPSVFVLAVNGQARWPCCSLELQ